MRQKFKTTKNKIGSHFTIIIRLLAEQPTLALLSKFMNGSVKCLHVYNYIIIIKSQDLWGSNPVSLTQSKNGQMIHFSSQTGHSKKHSAKNRQYNKILPGNGFVFFYTGVNLLYYHYNKKKTSIHHRKVS